MNIVCQSSLMPAAVEGIAALAAANAPQVDVMFGQDEHFDVQNDRQIANLKEYIDATQLRVSVHCEFGDNMDLSSPDENERQLVVEKLMYQIELAGKLGAEIACVHPGIECEEGMRGERVGAAAEGMSAIMPAAEAAGVNIAFENLPPGYVGDTPEELSELVDGLDSPKAGICMDTGHCHIGGISTGEMIEAFGDRIFLIHWHDNHGEKDEHLIPGLGTIDWDDFYNSLDAIGYDGPVMLESSRVAMSVSDFARIGQLAIDERRAVFV